MSDYWARSPAGVLDHNGHNGMTVTELIKALESNGLSPDEVTINYGNCGSHEVKLEVTHDGHFNSDRQTQTRVPAV